MPAEVPIASHIPCLTEGLGLGIARFLLRRDKRLTVVAMGSATASTMRAQIVRRDTDLHDRLECFQLEFREGEEEQVQTAHEYLRDKYGTECLKFGFFPSADEVRNRPRPSSCLVNNSLSCRLVLHNPQKLLRSGRHEEALRLLAYTQAMDPGVTLRHPSIFSFDSLIPKRTFVGPTKFFSQQFSIFATLHDGRLPDPRWWMVKKLGPVGSLVRLPGYSIMSLGFKQEWWLRRKGRTLEQGAETMMQVLAKLNWAQTGTIVDGEAESHGLRSKQWQKQS